MVGVASWLDKAKINRRPLTLLYIALAIFFVWLWVSIYFYGQHLIVVNEYPFYVQADTEKALIILRNITVTNCKRKVNLDYKPPWYFYAIQKVPNHKIGNILFNICFFYSKPYEFSDDERSIRIEGLVAFKNSTEPLSRHDYEKLPYDVGIYGDFDVRLTHSLGSAHEDGSNILYIDSDGKNTLIKNNHIFKVIITDRKSHQVIKEIAFKPDWKISAYGFFDQKPLTYQINPEITVKKFLKLVQNNEKTEAAKFLHINSKGKFPWENLNHSYFEKIAQPYVVQYVGNYANYKNVFKIDVKYHKKGNIFTGQTIYFTDYFGSWKLIDISPLR